MQYCFLQLWFVLFLCITIGHVCKASNCSLMVGNPYKVAYTVSVSKTGPANFSEVQKAIDSIPSQNTEWIRIQVSPDLYVEKVTIPREKPCIFLDGAGNKLTIIQWGDHEATDSSATFTSFPDNVLVRGITFKNTFNHKLLQDQDKPINIVTQALAARVYGDKSAFYQCSFLGLQDTLWDVTGRHYFNNCYFEGAIDFIFGSGQSIYEKCLINVTKDPEVAYGYITAQGKNSPNETNGFVFQCCSIVGMTKAYLGRAYGAYSTVIWFRTYFSDIIIPQGWDAWDYVGQESNFLYAELNNEGPGADTSQRGSWVKTERSPELSSHLELTYIDNEGWIPNLPLVP